MVGKTSRHRTSLTGGFLVEYPGRHLIHSELEQRPKHNGMAVAPAARSKLFASNSWAKSRGGKGRGTGGHYFDQGKAGSETTDVGAKHYWTAVQEEPAPRVSANPYFGSLASEGICACGSSNVGRHMCFDCGRERQPTPATRQESQLEGRPGDGYNTKAVKQDQASQGRRFCIHCGAPQVAAAKFCSECGERCINPAGPAISQPEVSGSFQRRGGYFEKAPAPQHGAGVSKPVEDEVDSFQDYKAQLRKEVLNAPATERGVGAYIRSLEGGELWGRVVCDQGRSWQLASGRSAKKENEGKVWVFEDPNAIKAPKVVPEATRRTIRREAATGKRLVNRSWIGPSEAADCKTKVFEKLQKLLVVQSETALSDADLLSLMQWREVVWA
eukprot:s212_g22.t1